MGYALAYGKPKDGRNWSFSPEVPKPIQVGVRRNLIAKMRQQISTDPDFESKRMDETVRLLMENLDNAG